jgi:prepilin-type N-terminal cleavage/methylation domain-containing protein
MFQIKQKNYGFTIVELLIVIVVIAILAAISIVAYNGIQNRANDSAVQQDLANYAKKTELYRIQDTSNNYPGNEGNLTTLEMKASTASYDTSYYNLYYCASGARDKFTFAGRSKSGTLYYASSQGSGNLGKVNINTARTCSTVGIDSAVDSYVNLTGKTNNGTGDWRVWTQ